MLDDTKLAIVIEKMKIIGADVRRILDILDVHENTPVVPAVLSEAEMDAWAERWSLSALRFCLLHGLDVRTTNALRRNVGYIKDAYRIAVLDQRPQGYPRYTRERYVRIWTVFARGSGRALEFDEWLAGVVDGTQNATMFYEIGKKTAAEILVAARRELNPGGMT